MSEQETSRTPKPVLRVFMTENYFSVTDKLLERLKARFSSILEIQVEYNIKKVDTCDLIIGDRHGIPYKVLRAAPARSTSNPDVAPPLINFFEGAQRLTLKVSMTKLLKDFPSASSFYPKTFILAPKQQPGDTTTADASATDDDQQTTTATNKEPPKKRSALPSKAERMALAAKKKQEQDSTPSDEQCPFCVLAKVSSLDEDEREELAAEMKKNPDSVWIAKPTAGSKGVGILISRDLNEMIQHVDSFNPSTAPSHDQVYGGKKSTDDDDEQQQQAVVKKSSRTKFVIQKYIDKPLLVQGNRKFDVRVWCSLSSPSFNIHVFSEGSCRTASVPYSGTANLQNQFEHVTNHDLQQYAPGYGQNEAGNEMWYDAFAEFLQEKYSNRVDELRQRHYKLLGEISSKYQKTKPFTTTGAKSNNIFEEFVRPQFHHVIIQCFLAARDVLELDKFERFQAFQIYGFDMMLDDELNVHLLEANSAPGFAQCLLGPGVDGAIEELIAPRVPAIGKGVAMEEKNADEKRKGYWEKVF